MKRDNIIYVILQKSIHFLTRGRPAILLLLLSISCKL